MNVGVMVLAGAVMVFLGAAAPAHAITVQLDFTADFAPPSPVATVTGRFIYEAPSLTSEITSLTSVDLTISGHTYTLGELGFAGSFFPGNETIGTTDPALGIADFGKDTLFLTFALASGTPLGFGYGTSSPPGISSLESFSQFSLTAIPEPATWAMLLTGFLGAGALAARKRLSPASI
jgi:hypothetical protein